MAETARPLPSTVRDAIAAVIKVTDTTSKVHVHPSNAKERSSFKRLFMVANQVRAWLIAYAPTQPADNDEDEAGDLYLDKQAFELTYWHGPYNDAAQTGVDATDIIKEVKDGIAGDQTIFGELAPEITERTVTFGGMVPAMLHHMLCHKGTLIVTVTARLFKVVQ